MNKARLCISVYRNALWRWQRCFNFLFINNYFHLTNHHTDNQVSYYTGSGLIYSASLWYTGNNFKVQGYIDLQNNNNNNSNNNKKDEVLFNCRLYDFSSFLCDSSVSIHSQIYFHRKF